MRIRDLLNPQAVCLNAEPKNKEEAINILVDMLSRTDCICDAKRFKNAVFERESKGSTGLGEGVAIPHAKSAGVVKPGLAAMVSKEGVDFDSLDGKKAFLFFLIASPHQASDAHIDVLARLSSLLIDDNFRKSLIEAKSKEEFLDLIDNAEVKEIAHKEKEQTKDLKGKQKHNLPKYDLVAVTACPAGLSHTYMAAKALEHCALEMGVSIKVEADGAAGNRNRLLPEDIANAKAVIVAADRMVDMDRFIGKPLVRTGVVSGIRKPDELITKALDPACPIYLPGSMNESTSFSMRLYRHLMSGLTYIMPLAATAGILSAIARQELFASTNLGLFLDSIGYSIGTLLFPVLSAFIAFSISGRMALVAGFTGGVMADMFDAGVIGAVLNGFVGGGVGYISAAFGQRFLKGHDAMFALLVYPLVGALCTTLIAQFITNLPSAFINSHLEYYLSYAPKVLLVILGGILGGMMSADMGGPCNKIAYACGVLLLADCLPESGPGSNIMASVMAGGMVPPLSAGLAALAARRFFTLHEKNIAMATVVKGLFFITEGVLPYLIYSPFRMRIACIVSSAVAGALSMWYGCGLCAPHGGIFIIPLAENAVNYVISLSIATLVGICLFIIFRIGQKHNE